MKILNSLLSEIEHTLFGNKDLLYSEVTSIYTDSRTVCEGAAFFCLTGAKADGHDFAKEAYKKGSHIFFCEHTLDIPHDALQIKVKNTRAALAIASASFFDHPEKRISLIGVTGTKGKSTVCEMISHILNSAGKKCAVISTLGIKIGAKTEKTDNSTPESFIIYKALAEALAQNVQYAAVEVSSQALCTHRTDGLRFSAAIFTNLSRDHIGTLEHPNFTHYKEAKKSLFSRADAAFINADDAFADEFATAASCPVYSYGYENPADVRAENIHPLFKNGTFGISFSYKLGGSRTNVSLPLPGRFSALNALAAISVCDYFGVPPHASAQALADINIVGRFEIVPSARRDITCVIDYAHNASSLSSAISAMREYSPARIVCVFGSVGGRTRERRRELGEAASRLADLCIVTSDNPDTEAPENIISEISAFIPQEKCICITDRAEAVAYALDTAQSGDFLLFVGKGHEQYQLVNGKKLPFSERELIKNHIFKKNFIPFP